MAQFDDMSRRYHCCCECCHLKNATLMVGGVEALLMGYVLVNSLVLVANSDGARNGTSGGGGGGDGLVYVPFACCMLGLAVGAVVVVLLFVAVLNRRPPLLIPHLVLQAVSVVCFFALLVCAIVALATRRVVFYRLLNALAFDAPPDDNTVRLSFAQNTHLYAVLLVYLVAMALEIWFCVVVFRCYHYLQDRRAYDRHCASYCTPMKAVNIRMHQLTPR